MDTRLRGKTDWELADFIMLLFLVNFWLLSLFFKQIKSI
jgi:hypothetical protein